MKKINSNGVGSKALVLIFVIIIIIVFLMNPFGNQTPTEEDGPNQNGTNGKIIENKNNVRKSIDETGGLTYETIFSAEKPDYFQHITSKNYINPDGKERTESIITWGGDYGEGISETITISYSSGRYQRFEKIGSEWVLRETKDDAGDPIMALVEFGFSKENSRQIIKSLLDVGISQENVQKWVPLLTHVDYVKKGTITCGDETCDILYAKEDDMEVTLNCRADGFCPVASVVMPGEEFKMEQTDPIFGPISGSLFTAPE